MDSSPSADTRPKGTLLFLSHKDITVSFVSFPLQMHVNNAVRNYKACCLTGETDSMTQVGRFTLMVQTLKSVPENLKEHHDTREEEGIFKTL